LRTNALPLLHFVLPGDPETRTGGYEYDRRIVAGLRARGWTVNVLSLPGDWPNPDAAAHAAAAAQLAALPDESWVAVDGLAFGAMPRLAATEQSRLRLIALVHHPLAAETGIGAEQAARLCKSERAALAAARGAIVTSAATAAQLRVEYGVSAERIAVVEPGVDRAHSDARFTTRRPMRADSPSRLLYVATVTPRKAHLTLIDAVGLLADRDWELHCIGSLERDPRATQALRERIDATGLGNRVHLRGELDGAVLSCEYNAADIYVSAALYEGYGMAVAEALAHGVPVVATRVGAAPALLANGAGLLVRPGDAAELAAALARLLDDAALRERCIAAAAHARETLADWTRTSAKFATAVERLVGVGAAA
jgi:glycosyltransferase involved in cell wall biosynthesis